MFRRSTPTTAPQAPLDLSQPHDKCLKCGRPTPLGVSLCEKDNPGRIKSPSTTQVHGTIVVGVLVGFGLLLLLFRFGSAAAGIGPFNSQVIGVASRAGGGLDVVIQVQNTGDHAGGTSCRISAAGAPDFRDYTFFSDPIGPGQTVRISQSIPTAPGGAQLSPDGIAVNCT